MPTPSSAAIRLNENCREPVRGSDADACPHDLRQAKHALRPLARLARADPRRQRCCRAARQARHRPGQRCHPVPGAAPRSGLLARGGQRLHLRAPVPAVILSSAFEPVATMPAWLQAFARHQPETPVIGSIRRLLLHQPLSTQPRWRSPSAAGSPRWRSPAWSWRSDAASAGASGGKPCRVRVLSGNAAYVSGAVWARLFAGHGQ